MIGSLLSLFCALLLLSACGDGSADAAKAAARTPSACVVAPAPILNFRFHTVQPGSTVNGQPVTGAFSTSAGPRCTAQDRPCLYIENIRLPEAHLVGFGATGGNGQVGLELSKAGGPTRGFTGTITISPGQLRIDATDGKGSVLVLIGDR